MNVLNQLASSGNELMHSPAFLQVIRDHKEWLLQQNTTQTLTIAPGEGERAYKSLSRILSEKNIPYDIHQIIAIVNGLECPSDFRGDLDKVYIPDRSVINSLISRHNTSHKML